MNKLWIIALAAWMAACGHTSGEQAKETRHRTIDRKHRESVANDRQNDKTVALQTLQIDEGKDKLKRYCLICHTDQPAYGNHEGLTAPPFPGVVRHYKEVYSSKEEFIRAVTAYVKKPDSTRALMRGAVEEFGLMPPLPLPDDTLKVIAETLYEMYDMPAGRGRGRGHGKGHGRGRGRMHE